MDLDQIVADFEEKCENSLGEEKTIKQALQFIRETSSKKDGETPCRIALGLTDILLDLTQDKETILAGLLHESTPQFIEEKTVKEKFGNTVLEYINLINRLEKAMKFKPDDLENSQKKLIIVLSTNPNIAILKLSKRLFLLRNLTLIQEKEKLEFIKETKKIYATLAYKLGIYSLSSEMYDLIFKYEEPEKYDKIKKSIKITVDSMKEAIQKTIDTVKLTVDDAGIEAKISGRTKTIYSTYNKMKRKNIVVKKIYDLMAIRVIVSGIKECYEVLGIVHSLWKPTPGEFDDYIAKPKSNGYRSLHTTVTAFDYPLEIQIRTEEMHSFAELGIASHWRYKGTKSESKYDTKIEWVRQILDWQKTTSEKNDMCVFSKQVFAMTPKGNVIELPEGATVIDFAYGIHSDIGDKCKSAKINEKYVSLDTKIENGDVVEILTSPNQTPKVGWLNYAKTQKAKQKIRSKLKIQTKKEKSNLGKRGISHAIKTSDPRVKLGHCCSPLPGDEIVGFKTTKRKISVHRNTCKEAEKANAKKVDVVWDSKTTAYQTELIVKSRNRVGLLQDILSVFTKENMLVEKAYAKTSEANTALCQFKVNVKDSQQLSKIIEKIKKIDGVSHIYRE